jgi:exosome complex component RRP43
MTTALEDPKILAQLQPAEYYKRWMEQHFPMRPDHRTIDTFRPLSVQTGTIATADSSVTVRLGDTTVVAGIKLEVAEPSLSAPTEGFLVTNVTLCAGCNPQVRAGPPTDRAQNLTNRVATLLKTLSIIPDGALTIMEGKLVWVIHLDAMVINDEGNVFDAIWIAILSALKCVVLPVLRMDEEAGLVYSGKEGKALRLGTLPLPLSFVYSSEREALIADPTQKEESIMAEYNVLLLIDPTTHAIVHSESNSVPLTALSHLFEQSGVQSHIEQLHSLLS